MKFQVSSSKPKAFHSRVEAVRRICVSLVLGLSFLWNSHLVSAQQIQLDDFKTQVTALALAQQPDGKILFAGTAGAAPLYPSNVLFQTHSDGSRDFGFLGSVFGLPTGVSVQEDGKAIIFGSFTNLSGQYANGIGRVKFDGTFDASFNANAVYPTNSDIRILGISCIAEQVDGKFLVAGAFTNIGGLTRSHVARITRAGIADPSFNPVIVGGRAVLNLYPEPVSSLAIQADGKILAGGVFDSVNGAARTNLVRLNPDGSLDTQFNP